MLPLSASRFPSRTVSRFPSSTWRNTARCFPAKVCRWPGFWLFRRVLQQSVPGDGNVEFPFPTHVVVGDEALATVVLAQGVGIFEPELDRRQVNAVGELHVFGKGALSQWVGGIEKVAVVDLVLAKGVDPA